MDPCYLGVPKTVALGIKVGTMAASPRSEATLDNPDSTVPAASPILPPPTTVSSSPSASSITLFGLMMCISRFLKGGIIPSHLVVAGVSVAVRFTR